MTDQSRRTVLQQSALFLSGSELIDGTLAQRECPETNSGKVSISDEIVDEDGTVVLPGANPVLRGRSTEDSILVILYRNQVRVAGDQFVDTGNDSRWTARFDPVDSIERVQVETETGEVLFCKSAELVDSTVNRNALTFEFSPDPAYDGTTDSITVDDVTLPYGGYLVIEKNGNTIGRSDRLPRGSSSDVEISLDRRIDTPVMVTARLALDEASNKLYRTETGPATQQIQVGPPPEIELRTPAEPVSVDTGANSANLQLATLENSGGRTGRREVTVELAEQRITQEVSVQPGEQQRLRFPALSLSNLDTGGYSYEVSTNGPERVQRGTLIIESPPTFEITVDPVTGVVQGRQLDLGFTVVNTGTDSDTQQLGLSVPRVEQVPQLGRISLAAGESVSRTVSLPTKQDDAGNYVATIETATDSVESEFSIFAMTPFIVNNVTVVTADPLEGTQLETAVTVENTGKSEQTQAVNLTIPGLGNASTELTLAPGSSKTQNFSLQTESGDAGDYTGTVETETDSREFDITVFEHMPFAVEDLTLVGSNPIETDQLEVETNIRNAGESSDTQTVSVSVSGIGEEETELSLDPDESDVIKFTLSTDRGDAGTRTVSVNTAKRSDSAEINIRKLDTFDVEITEVTTPVAGADPAEITVTVQNTGDIAGTKTIAVESFRLGKDSATITLESGESKVTTFTLPTSSGDAGDYLLLATSDQDSDRAEFTIREPPVFDVSIAETTRPNAGGELRITANVTNTGDITGSQRVTTNASTLGNSSKRIELDAGETENVTFSIPTSKAQTGSYDLRVESRNTSDSTTATVVSAPFQLSDGENIVFVGVSGLALGAAYGYLRLIRGGD